MKTNRLLITMVLVGVLILSGCRSKPRVGALRSESQSVELGDANSVLIEINMGAGDLELAGGAEKLLEADFTYNVDELKPVVEYSDGKLLVGQPDVEGLPLPDLRGITGFRNEWDLKLNNEVPMDLRLNMGAGTNDLRLADLLLTGLYITQGAGGSTVDLSGDWVHDLDATIETGAADITIRLPKDIGVRVEVEAGPHTISAPGLIQDGNVFTNAVYGVSDVTLNIGMQAGIGQINLEVEESTQAQDSLQDVSQ